MTADHETTQLTDGATAHDLEAQGATEGAGGEGKGKPDGTITVTVNGSPVVLTERALTGGELKAKAGVPPDYELYEVHGASTKPVADTDTIHVHEGSAFRAIPAGTFGARSRTRGAEGRGRLRNASARRRSR